MSASSDPYIPGEHLLSCPFHCSAKLHFLFSPIPPSQQECNFAEHSFLAAFWNFLKTSSCSHKAPVTMWAIWNASLNKRLCQCAAFPLVHDASCAIWRPTAWIYHWSILLFFWWTLVSIPAHYYYSLPISYNWAGGTYMVVHRTSILQI